MSDRISTLVVAPSEQQIDAWESVVHSIVDALEAGGECDALIARVDAQAGPGYDRLTFTDLHSWTSERDIAARIAMGSAPEIADLTVDDVVHCLRIINLAEEPQSSFCLDLLQRSCPQAAITDLIFYPKLELSEPDLAALILRQGQAPVPTLPAG